ncbi:MAG: TetR/AcrR family transcriptional regulator [Desulfomicrobium sp.]|nr:TetR/AcrR family transcriptional regulator [Pseudomonadota bacterium]MBV1713811.1 TetR/AcrR family transcriptional regulator [Desulfomicrobium sp.]MBU4572346.1 TetR/AcrR family transcriptional regulator [Pseudomonadota bacterium]MBU4594324.1 TetR/AcrR family transcriptional regulator [Pseudomonadota bacterium]MBV1719493.1 TetR/AcrR family transcriptional regulator [Desulfomicrobium sp.]
MNQAAKYLSAEERRGMAVKAVLELAAVQNPGDITTTAIAARMGLSQGGIFRHFSSKDEIWRTVMEWVATELYSRVARAAEAAASPLASLEAMFMAHIAFAVEYPGIPRMLFGELQKTESTPAKIAVASLLEQYGKLLAQKLAQGKSCGEVDSTIPTDVATSLFVGAVQGLIIKALLLGDMESMKHGAAETFALFCRAIRKSI